MLFISNAADLRMKLRSAKPIYTPKGDLLTVEPKIKAIFQHGVAPLWAVEKAQKAGLIVTGKPDGTNMQPYFSAYNTDAAAEIEGWDAETKAWVEERLLRDPANGTTYIRVEHDRVPAPWPKYDRLVAGGRGRTNEVVAGEIVETAQQIGVDMAEVVAYETENANRAEVLEALAAAAEPEALPDLVEA